MALVQVIPLGGAGEIGKNCSVVVQGDDMIVIDVGLSFPNEEMLGVDIVIPDFTYILENKEKLRGIFLTHAHEDHVGALGYLITQVKCPIYATAFTHAMVRNKLEERVGLKDIRSVEVKFGDKIEAGSLSVEFVRVTHSIPENASLAVRTDHGIILFTGDFKFDFSPVDGKLSDITRLAELGREGVVLLLSDSTNVERPGWSPSERDVAPGLRYWFTHAPGRVLMTMFSSSIHRAQQAFEIAQETGRKVAVAGRRMDESIDTCIRLGYLRIPPGVKIRLDQVDEYPPERLVILSTGSQGEPMSALVQMSKEEYSRMRIRQGDTVLYSARPIPGNEAAIWRTINRLFRIGANVVYEAIQPIHVSGHGYQEEIKMMINLTRPYYLAPVHGEPRHQHLYLELAEQMGWPPHRLFRMEDGLPLVIDQEQAWLGERVPCGRILVDNAGIPGITDEVLRDRNNLANDGVLVLTIAIDIERGEIVGEPQIQARGFSGGQDVIQAGLKRVEEELGAMSMQDRQDIDSVRHTATDALRRYMHKRAGLRPLVLSAIVEV